MTTTTHRHFFGDVGMDGPHVIFAIIIMVLGIGIGFATSSILFIRTMPAATSAISAPSLDIGSVEREAELVDARRSLELNQALLERIEVDTRWTDPALRAGMTHALGSTMQAISELEARIGILEAQGAEEGRP